MIQRRRQFMNTDDSIHVKNPSYTRIVVNAPTDGYEVQLGYTGVVIQQMLVDGVATPVQVISNYRCAVLSKGIHIIEILCSKMGTFLYTSCKEIWFPYNVSELSLSLPTSSWGSLGTVYILDNRYVAEIKTNKNSRFSSANQIFIPKGSKQLYEDKGVSATILNKMVEVDFKYKV